MQEIHISRSVRQEHSQNGTVLMEINQGMMYAPNPVGGRIIKLLSQGLTPSEVVETVKRECDAPQETVRRDLEVFVERLRSYDILS